MVGIMGLSYADEAKTLKEWGVPSIEGKEPYDTFEKDYSDKIDGKETLGELYKVNKELVEVFSVTLDGEKLKYAVVYDKDWKAPLDLPLFDYEGNGKFSKINQNDDLRVPKWLEKKVLKYQK